MTKRKIGDKREFLTLVNIIDKDVFVCMCDCGKEKRINRRKFGTTKSCGCLKHRTNEDHPTFKGTGDLYGKHWGSIVRNAKIRKLEINITQEYIWQLYIKQNKICNLSGLPIKMGRDRWTASLDRIDSNKGYIIDNVQWVHKMVNRMKQDMSQQEFLKMCKKITEHTNE